MCLSMRRRGFRWLLGELTWAAVNYRGGLLSPHRSCLISSLSLSKVPRKPLKSPLKIPKVKSPLKIPKGTPWQANAIRLKIHPNPTNKSTTMAQPTL